MMVKENLVQRMEFQFQIDQESHFDLLAKEVPKVVSRNLENFIDRSIQELGLDSQFLIIDRLVLDLGRLDISNLKSDLQEKFKLHFKAELKKNLSNTKTSNIPEEDLTFFVFLFFIKNGVRPWWLNNQARHIIEFAEKAFLLHPQKFIGYFKSFINRPEYRKRFLDHLSAEFLVRLLIQERRVDRSISLQVIDEIRHFLREKHRQWNENQISAAFKEIILMLFQYRQPIDQVWKLHLAIAMALDNLFPYGMRWPGLQGTLPPYSNQRFKGISGGNATPIPEKITEYQSYLVEGEGFIAWFQFYLENGYAYPAIPSKSYNFRSVNFLFKYLLFNQLDQLTSLLLRLGRVRSVRDRFLESISQELLNEFFSRISPSKKKLLEWVEDIFYKVQEEYKPINQTFINVKKSINEITFELFLTKKLHQISDESYLRFLFKQSSKKFGVSYKDLLFFTLKSLASTVKKLRLNNFYQLLSAIYSKDILKNKVWFSVERSVQIRNVPKGSGTLDFQNKEYVYQLFLDSIRGKGPGQVRMAEAWLKSNLDSQSIDDTGDLLKFWEIFASKFDLRPEQVLIPILVEKHKNPSIHLSIQAFNFWKRRYAIKGLFSNKKPDESFLIHTLQEHKKSIDRDSIKSILLGINWGKRADKIDFKRVANLIHTGDTTWITSYLSWMEKLLKENQLYQKKALVSNWFLHQLILLPQKNLTLNFLQKKTLDFLQTDDKVIGNRSDGVIKKSSRKMGDKDNSSGGPNLVKSERFGMYPKKAAHNVFRLFEILGRSSILEIFPEAKKYDDKFLFQLLTTKYEAEFLILIKTHQFNEELQDYLLIQAPAWLKKQLLDFLSRHHLDSWSSTVSSLQHYFEKNKWIHLSGPSLFSYIEKNIWFEIFDSRRLSFGELAAQQLQSALNQGLISNSFWIELSVFQSGESTHAVPGESPENHGFSFLRGTDFLSYAETISKRGGKGMVYVRILENILLRYRFPEGHPFEDYLVEDFQFYIQDLISLNKKSVPGLLNKSESPSMLFRFLRLFDMKSLRFVIQENHKKLGFPSLIKQMDAVFSSYEIKEKSKLTDFWVTWIEILYFQKPERAKLGEVYAVFFRVLLEEGIVSLGSLGLFGEMKPLLSLLQMEGKEENVFVKELIRQIGNPNSFDAQGYPLISSLSNLSIEEFESFIQKPIGINRKILTTLLTQVESPPLMIRYLGKLNDSTLRFIIQDYHSKFGQTTLLKKLDGIFSFYKVSDPSKIKAFYRTWIVQLYFRKSETGDLYSSYVSLFRIMLEEGILSIPAYLSMSDQKNLLSVLGLRGKEGVRFMEELVQMTGIQPTSQESIPAKLIPETLFRFEDFGSFLEGLEGADRDAVTWRLLSKIESPVLLFRILKTLDASTLRFLIEQHYVKLGALNSLRKLVGMLSFFKITEETKVSHFFTAWLGLLFFRKVDLKTLTGKYVSVIQVLLSEGMLTTASLLQVTDWQPLFETLSLGENEKGVFIRDLEDLDVGQKLPVLMDTSRSGVKKSLRELSPNELIINSNGLSLSDYVSHVKSAMGLGFFNSAHHAYIQEWVKFAVRIKSKAYLQSIVQLYWSKNLKITVDTRLLKTRLFYAFVDRLIVDGKDVNLFLTRISLAFPLIEGILWLPLQKVNTELSVDWPWLWSQANGSLNEDEESSERQELIFNLFLTSGWSVFQGKSNLQRSLSKVSKQLEKVPMSDLLAKPLHPEVFIELVKVKSAAEIREYFVRGMDPHLKAVNGNKFLFAWFEEFFKLAEETQLLSFLQLFHRSFYSDSLPEAQRMKSFLKGFLKLEEAMKTFRKTVDKDLVEMGGFFRNSPELLDSLRQPSKSRAAGLSTLDIFQWYLEVGKLPEGISEMQQLANQLMILKGTERDRLRIFIHAGLQVVRHRQTIYKLLPYLDEVWFLNLIHSDLFADLDELNKGINVKIKVDFFADLRISKRLDRMVFISSYWENLAVKVKSSLIVLLPILEKWVGIVDADLVSEVFSDKQIKSKLLSKLKISSKRVKKIVEESLAEEAKSNLFIPEEIESIDYGEGVSIANAGLILLWPFLGRFFNALGMVGKEGMKGEVIRERAIQLLQYIATGLSEFEEWDLTLNKILCGASPGFSVSPQIELTAEEQELCEKLVKGTIYNWEKMRGTRMETFRETFIQREGRLYQKENRWELIVDTKAYDVLLDTLPWNISMINLSWMNTRITVQWR